MTLFTSAPYLLLYNLIFVLPPILIHIIVYWGYTRAAGRIPDGEQAMGAPSHGHCHGSTRGCDA